MQNEDISIEKLLPVTNDESEEPSTYHKKKSYNYTDDRCNNKQIKILIIRIITLLTLAIIIMLITLIVVVKLRNKKDGSSESIMNMNSYSDPKQISTIYDVGNGGISGDPPCTSHTVINDPSRSITALGFGRECDDGPLFNTSIGGRWVRFMGTGGTMMPNESPGMKHCSAFLAGWFNTMLPTVTGVIVNGSVCFDTFIGPCIYFVEASVMKCNSFYIYFLPSVLLCNARYCTV